MISFRRFWFAWGLAVGIAGPLAHGQPVPDDEAPDANAGQVQGRFELPEEHFDQWAFQAHGNAATARSRLDSQLQLQIDNIDRNCQLTAAQKTKLQLAGKGDLARFLGRVEQVRAKFLEVRKDQQRIGEVFQELQPLQMALQAGLFGERSFLYKSLPATLTADQLAKQTAVMNQRRQFRYEAKVGLVIAMLENNIPLEDEQRQKLTRFILAETKPPKVFGQYDYHVVLLQLSKLPADKLKALFDDAQWRMMNQQLAQGRGMEPFLKQNGFLP